MSFLPTIGSFLIGALLSVLAASSTAPLIVGGGTGTLNQLQQWIVSGANVKLASTTAGVRVPSLANCDTIDTNGSGVFACGTDATGGAGGSFPFTATANYNGTSTPMGLLAGLFSNSSTTINGNFFLPGITDKALSTNASGLVFGTATGTVTASNGISLDNSTRQLLGGALAISGVNAIADGATKGVASFTANDFDSASANISIDYTNGQAAAATTKGFLAAADFLTFRNKIGTSTAKETAGQIGYYTTTSGTPALMAPVSTTSISGSTGISLSASPGALVGGSALTITNTGVTSNVAGAGISVSSGTGAVTVTNTIGYEFPSDATSTLLNFSTGLKSASTTLTGPFVFGSATGTAATTTNLSVSGNASTTALVISNTGGTGTRCLQVGADGTVSANASACGTGGGSWAFTPGTYGALAEQSTTTLYRNTIGIVAQGTSTIGDGTAKGGLTIDGVSTSTQGISAGGNGFVVSSSGAITRLGGSTVSMTGAFLQMANTSGQVWLQNNVASINSPVAIKGGSLTNDPGSGVIIEGGGKERARFSGNGMFGLGSTTPFQSIFTINTPGGSNGATTTLFMIASSTATATTTLFQINNVGLASTTGLTVSGLNAASCDLKADTNGAITCGTDATGSSFSYPFTYATTFNTLSAGTSTSLWLQGSPYSLFASSTSIIDYASTTALTVKGLASTTNLTVSGLNAAACDVKSDTNGVFSCGTDATAVGNSQWTTVSNNIWYPNGSVGLSTSSPYALLTVAATSTTGTNAPTVLFAIASSTGGTATTTLLSLNNTGLLSLRGVMALVDGANNTFIQAGNQTVSGTLNVGLGGSALLSLTSGAANMGIGSGALNSITSSGDNVGIGSSALSNMGDILSAQNIAIGSNAGANVLTASSSVLVGYLAGQGTVASGYRGATAIGWESGMNIRSNANFNTFVGYGSGNKVTTGANNILIGAASTVANDNLTTGSGNIKIGYNNSFPSATANNQLNIGNIIYGSNLDGTGATLSNASIGIGIASPSVNFLLHLSTSTTASAGLEAQLAISDAGAASGLKNWLFSSMGGNFYLGTSTDAYATSTLAALTVTNAGNFGISTSSPAAILSVVNTQATVPLLFAVASSTATGAAKPNFEIDAHGRIVMSGQKPLFAASSCGTSPSVTGSDAAGQITVGTSNPTQCTLTFATTYGSAPACVISGAPAANVKNAAALISSTSATVLNIMASSTTGYGTLNAWVISYICMGLQ